MDGLAVVTQPSARHKGVVAAANGLVAGHLAVRLDAVLEAVELPAGVTGLDAGLAHVRETASRIVKFWWVVVKVRGF